MFEIEAQINKMTRNDRKHLTRILDNSLKDSRINNSGTLEHLEKKATKIKEVCKKYLYYSTVNIDSKKLFFVQ